jgi:hypothetical protein
MTPTKLLVKYKQRRDKGRLRKLEFIKMIVVFYCISVNFSMQSIEVIFKYVGLLQRCFHLCYKTDN